MAHLIQSMQNSQCEKSLTLRIYAISEPFLCFSTIPVQKLSAFYPNVALTRLVGNTSKVLECGFLLELDGLLTTSPRVKSSEGNGPPCLAVKTCRSKPLSVSPPRPSGRFFLQHRGLMIILHFSFCTFHFTLIFSTPHFG